jgi:hypothetical protein
MRKDRSERATVELTLAARWAAEKGAWFWDCIWRSKLPGKCEVALGMVFQTVRIWDFGLLSDVRRYRGLES